MEQGPISISPDVSHTQALKRPLLRCCLYLHLSGVAYMSFQLPLISFMLIRESLDVLGLACVEDMAYDSTFYLDVEAGYNFFGTT